MVYKRVDEPAVFKALGIDGWKDYESIPGAAVVSGGGDEFNHASYEEREELAKAAGITFHGWNGPGGNYGPAEFVAKDGEMLEMGQMEAEGPCLPLKFTCGKVEIDAELIGRAQRYFETKEAVLNEFEELDAKARVKAAWGRVLMGPDRDEEGSPSGWKVYEDGTVVAEGLQFDEADRVVEERTKALERAARA